jgi:hypothetical protein
VFFSFRSSPKEHCLPRGSHHLISLESIPFDVVVTSVTQRGQCLCLHCLHQLQATVERIPEPRCMLCESHSEWMTNASESFDYLGADLFQPHNHAGNCNKHGSVLIFPVMGKRFQGFALQGSQNRNHG